MTVHAIQTHNLDMTVPEAIHPGLTGSSLTIVPLLLLLLRIFLHLPFPLHLFLMPISPLFSNRSSLLLVTLLLLLSLSHQVLLLGILILPTVTI